jgi:hypothetical protein
MHRVVRMFKNAKTKEDGLWLLSLLEGSGAPGERGAETPWLTQFVDQDGLSAMGAWLCDDNCLGTTFEFFFVARKVFGCECTTKAPKLTDDMTV